MARHGTADAGCAGHETDQREEQTDALGLGRQVQAGEDMACSMFNSAPAFLKAYAKP